MNVIMYECSIRGTIVDDVSCELSAVAISFEVKPELKDIVVELAAKAPLIRVFPLLVDYLERYVLRMITFTHVNALYEVYTV